MTPASPDSQRFWNVREVAEVTRLSTHTIYKMVSQGRIPYVKMGRLNRFDSRQIERWIHKHSVKERTGLGEAI